MIVGQLLFIPSQFLLDLCELLLHHGKILRPVQLHSILHDGRLRPFQLLNALCQFFIGHFEVLTDQFQLVEFEVEHDLSSGHLLGLLALIEDIIHLIQKVRLVLALALARRLDADGLHALRLGLLVGVERFAAAYRFGGVLRAEERAEFVLEVLHLLLLHYIIKGNRGRHALPFGLFVK